MNDPTDDLKRAAPAEVLEQQVINEARAAEVRTQLARMWNEGRPARVVQLILQTLPTRQLLRIGNILDGAPEREVPSA